VLHSVYDGNLPSAVVVRNPWDRLVSCARFLGRHNDFEAWLYEEPPEDILKGTVFDIARTPQIAWVANAKYVLRFENLANDWNDFCATFGLPEMALHSVHRQAPVDYIDFYTQKTKSLVARRFKSDIDRWGTHANVR
jgi:hypothetical protein